MGNDCDTILGVGLIALELLISIRTRPLQQSHFYLLECRSLRRATAMGGCVLRPQLRQGKRAAQQKPLVPESWGELCRAVSYLGNMRDTDMRLWLRCKKDVRIRVCRCTSMRKVARLLCKSGSRGSLQVHRNWVGSWPVFRLQL